MKDLLIDWRQGAHWFWDTLVDADLAQQRRQLAMGRRLPGADAAPYFRIFNPVPAGRKFDPDGSFVRRFVPELAQLPAEQISTNPGGRRPRSCRRRGCAWARPTLARSSIMPPGACVRAWRGIAALRAENLARQLAWRQHIERCMFDM